MYPVRAAWCVTLSSMLLAATLSFGPGAAAQSTATSLVVVVARKWTVHDIAFATLKRAYRGEVTELAGERLRPVNYAIAKPMRQDFDRLVLGALTPAVSRYWLDRKLRGQGLPPPEVANDTVLRALIARVPNAIAYMSPRSVDSSLRILTVDGKSYTDPEYPLQPALP